MENLKKLRQNQITFKCEICDNEFKNNSGLRQHFNNIHNSMIERALRKNETMSNELISLPINVKKSPTSINYKLQLQNLIKFLNRELNLSNNVNT